MKVSKYSFPGQEKNGQKKWQVKEGSNEAHPNPLEDFDLFQDSFFHFKRGMVLLGLLNNLFSQ